MGKLASTLLATTLCAALAACGSEAAEPPPHTSSAPSTPAPTTSPSPTPPVMPDLAKQHTAEGAKAFVVYFWQVVDYAMEALDPAALRPLVREDCTGCRGGIRFISKVRDRGGVLVGGDDKVSSITANQVQLGTDSYYSLTFKVTNTEQRVTYPGGQTKVFPRATSMDHFMIHATPTGWVVTTMEAA